MNETEKLKSSENVTSNLKQRLISLCVQVAKIHCGAESFIKHRSNTSDSPHNHRLGAELPPRYQ